MQNGEFKDPVFPVPEALEILNLDINDIEFITNKLLSEKADEDFL